MNNLFAIAEQNTIVALLFALFVFGLTRFWRNPPVAHVLWVLVLLKLVGPPVMHVDWLALQLPELTNARGRIIADLPPIEAQQAESDRGLVDRPITRPSAEVSTTSMPDNDFAASIGLLWNRARSVLFWFWLGGTVLCALVAAKRIIRFERLLRDTVPAAERLQRLAVEIASKLGVRRVPDIRISECVEIPLLWCAGQRRTIVLPIRLLRQLDDQQTALILAHELAHLRRRDHWVRAVELIVSIVYWWNPLVWVIRRQLHQAEDLCCDAWVHWTFPDCRRRYAEVVLQAAESLSASQVALAE